MRNQLQSMLLLILFISANGWADEDHERARELVKSGEIIALEQLLQNISSQQSTQFRLLEAELERKNGQLVYELELVDENGMVREMLFNAKTGEALGEEDDD